MLGLEAVHSDGHNDHMKRKPMKLPQNTVGVADAKRDLIALIRQVNRSQRPITISRHGTPVAQIVPAPKRLGPRWRKEFTIPDDSPFWDAMRRISEWRKSASWRGSWSGRSGE
ncbi:MAG: type II toxin-antitoxin system Phd/YefM family antitoxin [Planctomycetes bacterium]|nr:type II toxin-antitoxin system Phd/YefM family antitoxin [Planctomycetota bacterium]